MGVQTLTASTHSCWQLDSEHMGWSFLREGIWPGGDTAQAATAHQHPPWSWWPVRDHGCRHTPAHGRGSPGALVKMKEMQDKEKLSQSHSQKFKLPHQAHPVSAESDSVINKER